MDDFFTHPTKRTAIIFTVIGLTGALLTVLAETNFFAEKFDPGILVGMLLVGAFWAVARVWINYQQTQRR